MEVSSSFRERIMVDMYFETNGAFVKINLVRIDLETFWTFLMFKCLKMRNISNLDHFEFFRQFLR